MANLSSELFTSTAIQNIPIETYFYSLILKQESQGSKAIKSWLERFRCFTLTDAIFADAAQTRAGRLVFVCLKINLPNFQLGMSGNNYKASRSSVKQKRCSKAEQIKSNQIKSNIFQNTETSYKYIIDTHRNQSNAWDALLGKE